MVPIWTLYIAFAAGGLWGIILIALIAANNREDDDDRRR